MSDVAYPSSRDVASSGDTAVEDAFAEASAHAPHLAVRAAFALGVAVLAVAIVKAWAFTVDDAFITCRYSRNVAEGLGATFNATGPRAEGYTTFAWMALLVVPHLFHLDAIAAAKALGVAATFGTLAVAARWAYDETRGAGDARNPPWAAAGTVLALSSMPATAVHAVSGMETALYTLLLTGMLAATAARVRAPQAAPWPDVRLAGLALLLGLTRPEGNLAAGVAILTCAGLVPRADRAALLARAAVVWVAPLAVYELCRWRYYGLPFPLPFYVKLGTPDRLPGLANVWEWLKGPVLFLALPMLPALARPRRTMWPALATATALVAFFVLPQHQMGYEHRYLAPLDPLAAVLAGIGLARIVATGRVAPGVARAAAGAALVLAVGLGLAGAGDVIAGVVEYGEGLAQAHARLGRELRGLPLPAGRLAIADAGAVPYFSGWWTIDLVGLNDAAIATTGRRDPARLFDEGIDVVVLASESAERFIPFDWNPWESSILEACTRAGFARVGLRRFGATYWLWVMARPGSDAARGLSATEPETARRPGAPEPKRG